MRYASSPTRGENPGHSASGTSALMTSSGVNGAPDTTLVFAPTNLGSLRDAAAFPSVAVGVGPRVGVVVVVVNVNVGLVAGTGGGIGLGLLGVSSGALSDLPGAGAGLVAGTGGGVRLAIPAAASGRARPPPPGSSPPGVVALALPLLGTLLLLLLLWAAAVLYARREHASAAPRATAEPREGRGVVRLAPVQGKMDVRPLMAIEHEDCGGIGARIRVRRLQAVGLMRDGRIRTLELHKPPTLTTPNDQRPTRTWYDFPPQRRARDHSTKAGSKTMSPSAALATTNELNPGACLRSLKSSSSAGLNDKTSSGQFLAS